MSNNNKARQAWLKYLVGAVLFAVALLLNSAAHAGQGWYLLTPPSMRIGQGVLTPAAGAPLSEWHHAGSFDSAKECQAERSSRLTLAAATRRKGDEGHALYNLALHYSRCVASDDPRLTASK